MSPREASFLDERPMVGGNYEIKWPRLTGRAVYESRTISGLNRIPVIIHSSYIVGQAQMPEDTEPPLDLDELTEALIVDGTLVILKPEENKRDVESPEYLSNIIEAWPDKVVQRLEKTDDAGNIVVRVWTKVPNGWHFNDWIKYGDDNQSRIKSGTIAGDRIYIFINGNGILAPAYDTMYRLEEIKLRVRRATNTAITMIIGGYAGDIRQAEDAFDDEDATNLVTPKQVSVDYLGTTAAVDQFLADSRDLLPMYWKQVRIIEVSDSADISGIARRIIMQPMLQYINSMRKKITKIYADWEYEVDFDPMPTMTVEERQQELALLTQLRDAQAIKPEEFSRRAAKLV